MKNLLLYLFLLFSLSGKAQTFTGRVVDASGTALVATSSALATIAATTPPATPMSLC